MASPTQAADHKDYQDKLATLGVSHPDAIPTKKASEFLTKVLGIPTAPSSLEVYRCSSRGPRYRKIGSRIFYTLEGLLDYAKGIEVKIFDPSCSKMEV